ncbi:MAG: DoxX family protein [Tepidisphaeraceae bacterium]
MDDSSSSWTVAGKVAFRFLFVYFILHILPFPFFGELIGTDYIQGLYNSLWYSFIPWVGKQVLHLPNDIMFIPNGSSDTTYHYVHLLTIAILALAVCVVWSVIDRRRKNYDQALYWGMIAVRYYLGVIMIGYGVSKVFMMQFGFVEERLHQTYGESTPMGLLWTFMGYSYAYNFFTGFAEVLGGVLVFFRRTTTAGALLLIAILSNVVLLNFTYNVPVKLYSSHLLLLAIIICLYDGKRILNFLLNRPAEPRVEKEYFTSGRIGQIRFFGNFILVAALLVSQFVIMQGYKEFFAPPPKSPLYGIYDVNEFVHDGPQAVDTIRWRSFRIGYMGSGQAISQRDQTFRFTLKVDTVQQTIHLDSNFDRYRLSYSKADPNTIVLTGTHVDFHTQDLQQQAVNIRLKKNEKDQVLVSREFSWINEYPDNR